MIPGARNTDQARQNAEAASCCRRCRRPNWTRSKGSTTATPSTTPRVGPRRSDTPHHNPPPRVLTSPGPNHPSTTSHPNTPQSLPSAPTLLLTPATVHTNLAPTTTLNNRTFGRPPRPRPPNTKIHRHRHLLKDVIKLRSKRNAVQGELFSEKLKTALNSYHNRAIATRRSLKS